MSPSVFFIGTSGWSYHHWQDIFYPKDIKPNRYLEYYITKFDCVELNSSFYHLPQKTTITGWVNRTPETFRFCPKLSRYITHQLRLVNAEEALEKFFGLFEGMESRLGPVLIQLPPGLAYDRSQTFDFLNLLKEHYRQYRFAIEIRNKTWITEDFFELISQYEIAFVIADSGIRYPYHEAVTADFVYLRFHGHEKLYASDYSDETLSEYARKIKQWVKEGKDVWAFFNNDFGGFAVKNAMKLRDML
ncbi:MAG: DUF72 domain-containing protein [Bacteroidales bacterium]|nr:DUF72 domain-containing protein [Bacteroidales bacterium]MBN2762951.1 DUF72 domain-containing protein [Bacteroidales bacterium]